MDDKDFLDIFGHRLQALRHKIGITQAEVAERIGVSTNFVGMVERGEINTTVFNMTKLIYALDSTLEDFFKGL
ncbi:MAG: helix-turn-helix transcriptional regulator [Candidatus Gastranaerophilales bacterium]|nr:helix-turn-helix transcriptional regulator [Candidatus Gastranaerophilales bacterium]